MTTCCIGITVKVQVVYVYGYLEQHLWMWSYIHTLFLLRFRKRIQQIRDGINVRWRCWEEGYDRSLNDSYIVKEFLYEVISLKCFYPASICWGLENYKFFFMGETSSCWRRNTFRSGGGGDSFMVDRKRCLLPIKGSSMSAWVWSLVINSKGKYNIY